MKKPDRDALSTWLISSVLFMIAGFVLVSAGASNGMLFLPGILLWVIGVLGAVYWVVNRLAEPRTAKWTVGLLVLS
jgi:hypothetical protein